MDTTNNTNVGGTAEDTGLIFTGGPIVVCGEGNSGHYDSEDLDEDTYVFMVGAAASATVTLTAQDVPTLSTFRVALLEHDLGQGEATLSTPASVQLKPDTYVLEVHVQNPTPIAASFPYRITVAPAASHATRDSR